MSGLTKLAVEVVEYTKEIKALKEKAEFKAENLKARLEVIGDQIAEHFHDILPLRLVHLSLKVHPMEGEFKFVKDGPGLELYTLRVPIQVLDDGFQNWGRLQEGVDIFEVHNMEDALDRILAEMALMAAEPICDTIQ